MSPRYEELKSKYQMSFVRKDQLEKYCKLGVITTEEYKDISGEDLAPQ